MNLPAALSTPGSSPLPGSDAGAPAFRNSRILRVNRVVAGLIISSQAVLGPVLWSSPDRLGAPMSAPASRAVAASHVGPVSWTGRERQAEEILIVDPDKNLLREFSRLNLTVIEQSRLEAIGAEIYRVGIPEGMSSRQTVASLRERFPHAAIGSDRFGLPAAGPDLGAMRTTSWVRNVGGWSAVAAECGRGIRIGMIDAVVDVGHPALDGQRVEYRSFHNPKRRPSQAVHGTAIAAMLVGRPSDQGWGGILPGAELKAANIFEFNEDGRLVGNALALLKAFDWMVAEKVHVVNLSMAGKDNEALRRVIEYARKQGLVTVAAAGNSGSIDRPAFPAAYETVIAVTAFGPEGNLYDKANQGAYIDFAAPGVGMWTAVPDGGMVQSGTSFAVPYVSAHIAVQVARGTARGPDDLRALLESRVTDMGSPGKDQAYGWGFIAEEPSCS